MADFRRFLPFSRGTLIPVIRFSGAIGTASRLQRGMSLETMAAPLQRAFSVRSAPAVALIVNSPGGSAAQSHLIHRRIRALAEEKGKKVIAFVEDVAASGGYMIAAAADEIIVDPSSIVGSIGVISASFGLGGLIEKIGVERRVYASGEHKSMLDPFLPENPDDIERLRAIQREIHTAFIDLVRSRRPRLAADPDLFSGAFWSGRRGIELGLADRIGDLHSVLRQRYGEDVRPRLVSTSPGLLRRLGLGSSLALPSIDTMLSGLTDGELWRRYGL